MTKKEEHEQLVQMITELLQTNPIEFQLKVVKKPKGIKIIYEITQEEMDVMLNAKKD